MLTGKFTLQDSRQVSGHLDLEGPFPALTLNDSERIHIGAIPDGCITGTLDNLDWVSLFGCFAMQDLGSRASFDRRGLLKEKSFHAVVCANEVIIGNRHLRPDDESIAGIEFRLDECERIFDTRSNFGVMFEAHDLIEPLLQADGQTNTEVGSNPIVAWFTGKTELFEVDTSIGIISAHHAVRSPLTGTSKGVHLENQIPIRVRFATPVKFAEACLRLQELVQFLTLIAGNRQRTAEQSLVVSGPEGNECTLKVHQMLTPDGLSSQERPSRGLLLDAVRNTEEFCEVIKRWFALREKLRDARFRFHGVFSQRVYTVDRIVAAANMFDLLSDSVGSTKSKRSTEFLEAWEAARAAFQEIPDSAERQEASTSLGLMKAGSKLRAIIEARAAVMPEEILRDLGDLELVIAQAVKCRNHYVHGSPRGFDYDVHASVTAFLTDSLEFIFGVSALTDAGWDMVGWHKSGLGHDHRFSEYLTWYRLNYDALRRAVE